MNRNIFLSKEFAINYIVSVSLIVLTFASVGALWSYLPNVNSQYALVALGLFTTLVIIKSDRNFSLICLTFLIMAVAHRYQANRELSLLMMLIILLSITAIGNFFVTPTHQELKHPIVYWVVLGLIASQTLLIFSFWPVSFFSRTLLSGAMFYLVWQYLFIDKDIPLKSVVWQIVFVSLTVIVIMGAIIWANFPHLIS
ncbi:hypothetical protein HY844_02515 [Candidatus Berkelbacteria bacterium]|nr:hypothetical protein [Candidatus Berkelbacteria bacterium]